VPWSRIYTIETVKWAFFDYGGQINNQTCKQAYTQAATLRGSA
jgi:hypothetical protein